MNILNNHFAKLALPLLFIIGLLIILEINPTYAVRMEPDNAAEDVYQAIITQVRDGITPAEAVEGFRGNQEMLDRLLFVAVDNGNLEVVTSLVNTGADIHAEDPLEHYPPVLTAISEGHLPIVRYFVSLLPGFDVNNTEMRGSRGASPLHLATTHPDVLGFLLTQPGANIDNPTITNTTPLHWAVRDSSANLGSVGLLIRSGADLNARDLNGETPLHNAVLSSHFPIVRSLVENGADIRAEDNLGRAPLTLAHRDDEVDHNDLNDEAMATTAAILASGLDVAEWEWVRLERPNQRNENRRIAAYLDSV